jgi:CRP/FNR family transcriptional regulator, cyclic AMP receptor protein
MLALVDAIRRSLWAKGLTPDQLARVERDTFERTIDAGDFVCRRGERPAHWLGVIDGLVKMSSDSFAGKPVTFTSIAQGGWFGEGTLLKNELRKADFVALRTSRVAFMPQSTFNWLLDNSIAFNQFLLHQLNERLGQFVGYVESARVEESDTRIAHCLASLFNPLLYPGMTLDLAISQTEIGLLTGASRQRTSQALHTLQDRGLLRIGYGSITIVDLDGLRNYGT